jgi:hypothetical protein
MKEVTIPQGECHKTGVRNIESFHMLFSSFTGCSQRGPAFRARIAKYGYESLDALTHANQDPPQGRHFSWIEPVTRPSWDSTFIDNAQPLQFAAAEQKLRAKLRAG